MADMSAFINTAPAVAAVIGAVSAMLVLEGIKHKHASDVHAALWRV